MSKRSPLSRRRIAFALLGIVAGIHFHAAAAPASLAGGSRTETRTALLIGNADYPRARLKNPVNDALAMQSSLRKLGFNVDLRTDATRNQMMQALRDFFRAGERSSVRLLFFAGHGIQWRGRNYLIPADAEIRSEDDLPNAAIDLNEVVERLGSLRHGVNIVVVDACRNNPFTSTVAQLADTRRFRTRSLTSPPAANEGLAAVVAPAGTLVAFSTAPGAVSVDSPDDRNSVYTRHLTERLEIPGLPVEKLFKEVRAAVATKTQFQQVPWESSSLIGEFCFRPDASGTCSR